MPTLIPVIEALNIVTDKGTLTDSDEDNPVADVDSKNLPLENHFNMGDSKKDSP